MHLLQRDNQLNRYVLFSDVLLSFNTLVAQALANDQQVEVQHVLETALGVWRTQLAQLEDEMEDQLSVSSHTSSSTTDSLVSLGDPTDADREIEELLKAAGMEDQLCNEFAIHPEYARILVEAGKDCDIHVLDVTYTTYRTE